MDFPAVTILSSYTAIAGVPKWPAKPTSVHDHPGLTTLTVRNLDLVADRKAGAAGW